MFHKDIKAETAFGTCLFIGQDRCGRCVVRDTIGRIKASSCWHAANASTAEADRQAAVNALIREAQDYDADAIVGLDFEVEGINSADVDGVQLQCIAVTGIAVKFAEAA